MPDTLIKVENVSKKFCRSLKRSLWYGLRDLGNELIGQRHGGKGGLRQDEFWAVNNVSFELKRGECLGLIGRNGAGKTTLLRMLNGLIKPDSGRIEIRGRVGAIISLGAGFNPILTGRENIYTNSSVLGLTRQETNEKLDEIIDFADIGDFIDSPVGSYSSGMQVRLGFAVAAMLSPDVLLLDEVLAVGDVSFRTKCYRRIDELRERAAVILVSHDMPSIARVSSQVMRLDAGQALDVGAPDEVIGGMEADLARSLVPGLNVNQCNTPIKRIKVWQSSAEVAQRTEFRVKIDVETDAAIDAVQLWISLQDFAGSHVAECVLDGRLFDVHLQCGSNSWELVFDMLPLRAGLYSWQVTLVGHNRGILAVSRGESQVSVTSSGPAAHAVSCTLPVESWVVLSANARIPKTI